LDNSSLAQLREAILRYDAEAAERITRKTLMEEGVDPLAVMAEVTDAIRQVGDKYASGELWLPDLIGAASTMKSAVPIIEEQIKKAGKKRDTAGSVVIGTVYGDVHSIGKGMVATLLLVEGFSVHDIGVDIRSEKFIEALKVHKPDILAMSALMTTTASEMKKVIEALKREGLREKVKILVGGAPITQDFADEIGADGFSPTAPGGAKLARRLVNK
jgi:methanogenic corrinoid protein MtbC1